MTATETVLQAIDRDMERSIGRWMEFLRIPSISAQPDHAADCAAAAHWASGQLAGLGFAVEIRPTAGLPCVVARNDGPPGAPHVLYYGHYDVQPADPLDLWHSPPFDPVLTDGPHGKRVVARGAVDDKGQVMTWLEAFRAWHATAGALPCRVTVLLEGEEEVGSPSLESFLAANRAEFAAADIAVISDTDMWDIDTPAIVTRLRGVIYVQIDLKAASRDLHSGMYGGSALNPINALTAVLGRLHDADGRVQIPNFYDGIIGIDDAERADWTAMGFDEASYLADIGLAHPVGEAGLPALMRLWARPTADLNGIWGGYMGPGSKTVIASQAHAKLTCRLVPGQSTETVIAGIKQFVAEGLARIPGGADAKVTFSGEGGAPGMHISTANPYVPPAIAALQAEYGKKPMLIGSGGSIPVVEVMKRVLGVDSLMIGFGLDDDQIHSPNEKFEVRCFQHGIRSHARLLAALAEVHAAEAHPG
jgi:acetylornithine deacetylase/succinyl-diaminopimelate desuccinylase-like protein